MGLKTFSNTWLNNKIHLLTKWHTRQSLHFFNDSTLKLQRLKAAVVCELQEALLIQSVTLLKSHNVDETV